MIFPNEIPDYIYGMVKYEEMVYGNVYWTTNDTGSFYQCAPRDGSSPILEWQDGDHAVYCEEDKYLVAAVRHDGYIVASVLMFLRTAPYIEIRRRASLFRGKQWFTMQLANDPEFVDMARDPSALIDWGMVDGVFSVWAGFNAEDDYMA